MKGWRRVSGLVSLVWGMILLHQANESHLFAVGAMLSFASPGLSYASTALTGIWCVLCMVPAVVCMGRRPSRRE